MNVQVDQAFMVNPKAENADWVVPSLRRHENRWCMAVVSSCREMLG